MNSRLVKIRGLAQSITLALVVAGLVGMPSLSPKAHASDPLVINNGVCNLPGGSGATNYSLVTAWDLWESTDCDGTTKVFTLAGPIDLTGVTNAPTGSPIGQPTGASNNPFSGTLDGNGHAITGLNQTLTESLNGMGLFASLNNAVVRNLSVSGTLVGTNTTDKPMGIIAGQASGRVTFSNVTVAGSLTGRSIIGGFVGQGSFTSGGRLDVVDSVNVAAVTGTGSQIGGFGGSFTGPVVVSNFQNFGQIRSVNFFNVGGLVGVHITSNPQGHLTASQVINHGTIRGTSGLVGGIAGSLEVPASILSSQNIGSIQSRVSGGFIGVTEQRVSFVDSENLGAVGTQPRSEEQGGFIGQSRLAVTFHNSTNSGAISGTSSIGGLIGKALNNSPVTITRSVNTGNISAFGADSGGFIGRAEGARLAIDNSENAGQVTGTSNTGGFAGNLFGSPLHIEGSTNTGPVAGTTNVGGLVGKASGHATISRVVNSGTVTSTTGYAGGFIGYTDRTVETPQSWNQGTVSGNNYIGGFIGFFFNDPLAYMIASDSLNTGAVNAVGDAAGLVGWSDYPHQIARSYQTGTVTVTAPNALADALYLDGSGSPNPTPSNLASVYTNQPVTQWIPVTTNENLRIASTFVGWDFNAVWGFIDCNTNNGFPVLRFAYPGQTFRTDGCTEIVVSVSSASVTVSASATTSSEVVETDPSPILFNGPLIWFFDKKELPSNTPTQLRVVGWRLNLITGISINGQSIGFTRVGNRELVLELSGLPVGIHRISMDTTRFGKLTVFRAFTVK